MKIGLFVDLPGIVKVSDRPTPLFLMHLPIYHFVSLSRLMWLSFFFLLLFPFLTSPGRKPVGRTIV